MEGNGGYCNSVFWCWRGVFVCFVSQIEKQLQFFVCSNKGFFDDAYIKSFNMSIWGDGLNMVVFP